MNENENKNKNVENNDNVESKNEQKHRHEAKFDPINGIGRFVNDNKKWFIIGGCFVAGVLLGGAGTMMINKGNKSNTSNAEQEIADPAIMEA